MAVYVFMYMFICMLPPDVIYFEASHWPSYHMIWSRPLIGQRQTPPFNPPSTPPPQTQKKLTASLFAETPPPKVNHRLSFLYFFVEYFPNATE